MKAFLRRHQSLIVNVFLVIALGRHSAVKAWEAWQADTFDFVEVAFAVHNAVLLTMILARRQHQSIDRRVFPQIVALVAFFSGLAFIKHPTEEWARLSQGITIAAWILGTVSLLNLGRSFGILIAVRQVKTGGLYRLVRHPMYLTDILWRVGYLAGNLCWRNAAIFVASTACYVYRAMLEERFLLQLDEYQAYARKVRYRFVPGIF